MSLPNIKFASGTITYRQGTDAAISLFLKNSAGVAVPATGWAIRFVAKLNYNAASNIIDLSTTNNKIEIVGNEVRIYFAQDSVKAFIKDQTINGVYQIEAIDTDNKKQILLDGVITIYKDIT